MCRDIAGRSQEPGTSTFGLTQVPEVALLTSGSSQNPRNTPVVANIKKSKLATTDGTNTNVNEKIIGNLEAMSKKKALRRNLRGIGERRTSQNC
mgnify:CR=1 FL=1